MYFPNAIYGLRDREQFVVFQPDFRMMRRELELHACAEHLRRPGAMEAVNVRVIDVNVLRPALDFRKILDVCTVERVVALIGLNPRPVLAGRGGAGGDLIRHALVERPEVLHSGPELATLRFIRLEDSAEKAHLSGSLFL